MKYEEKLQARNLRATGLSMKTIAKQLGVSKSSVSLWVRDIKLTDAMISGLKTNQHSTIAIEKRRLSRLSNEAAKQSVVIEKTRSEIGVLNYRELKLIGAALYWAEGGKTQRAVRFS